MKTPKEYTKNLDNHIITSQMLVDCLYSSNKRAKNYRDKEREYREINRSRRSFNYRYYDKYDAEGKARCKKEEYYKQKEIMLSILAPVCIHKEFLHYERIRIYDYETAYTKINDNEVVWENCYFDRDAGYEIWFKDIEDKNKPIYNYYLFYDIGKNHTFHTPIDGKKAIKYAEKNNLEIIEIKQLETYGYDPVGLISNQFVTKVIELIKSKDFTYVP